jgi:hypothetical protein
VAQGCDGKFELALGISDGDDENPVFYQKLNDLLDEFLVGFGMTSFRQEGFSSGRHNGGPMRESRIDGGRIGQKMPEMGTSGECCVWRTFREKWGHDSFSMHSFSFP